MSRKIGFGILIAFFVLLIVWVASTTYWEDVEVPMPPRGQAASNPFYGAEQFLGNLGVSSRWDRVQIDLPQDAVVVLSSWHWTLVDARRTRLEKWVEQGGRLVTDGNLTGGRGRFTAWSGIDWRNPRADEDAPPVPPAPAPECRSLGESVRAEGRPALGDDLQFCTFTAGTHLTTTRNIVWALRDDTGYQVLRVKVGKGSVTMVNGSPFLYREILKGDNARLLAHSAQLNRGDRVHFLSEDGQASLLSLMWQYGWPAVLLVLALIGLALWRNSVRFGPAVAQTDGARRSLAEQIRGTGQFVLRFGNGKALHAAAVRALDEAAQRRIASYRRMSVGERIEAVARLTGVEASNLAPAINHSGPRRLHELRQALALIETARRRLLIGKGR